MDLTPPFDAEQPPSVYGQDAQVADALILPNMAFFPAISLNDFQNRFRVDPSHYEGRLVECMQQSMSTVNRQLLDDDAMPDKVSWVNDQVQKGYSSLEETPGHDYGGRNENVSLYRSAIYAYCKALLIQRYPELFHGKKNRSDKQDPDVNTEADYLREYKRSLHQLMGKPTLTVELI